MSKSVKKWVNIGICVFITILLIGAAVKAVLAIIAYDQRVPDDFITVEEIKKGQNYEKDDFPKAIAFKYATKKEAAIVGKEKLLTYGVSKDYRSSYFFAVSEKDDVYTIETGDQEGYTTKDLTMFGMIQPFSLSEHSGEVTITFQTKDQYQCFMRDVHKKNPWRDVYEYYAEKQKSSK